MDAIYTVTTLKSFDETVRAIEEKTQENGFRVLHIHNVQATLAEKDFDIIPLKIIEVCNAKFAHSALQIDLMVSLLMPCKINVYANDGITTISTVRPRELSSIFKNENLNDFANDVERVLVKIIDESLI